MDAFKNLYNSKSLNAMATQIERVDMHFPRKAFLNAALNGLGQLEMKARVEHIADALGTHLPGSYRQQLSTLLKTLKSNKNPQGLSGFILWPYTYFIETRGLNSFEPSMKALYKITQVYTSEFGVRPFLESEPKRVYEVFTDWACDSNEHVRRWVSEGTRPNLPWGMNISHIKKNLPQNIKLLELLKSDDSLYVRKSVANHLNDIGWLDADLVLKTLRAWEKQKLTHIQFLKKQALRNLVKQGHPQALKLMGFNPGAACQIQRLQLSKTIVNEGDSFTMTFDLLNTGKTEQAFTVDYVIHFQKSNGETSPKVFKMKTLNLEAGVMQTIAKKIPFKKVTTRKHYSGPHRIQLQVNGKSRAESTIRLKV